MAGDGIVGFSGFVELVESGKKRDSKTPCLCSFRMLLRHGSGGLIGMNCLLGSGEMSCVVNFNRGEKAIEGRSNPFSPLVENPAPSRCSCFFCPLMTDSL